MKTMATQLSLLLRMGKTRTNIRLLLKFLLILTVLFVVYSVLFHLIMLHEGRQYSWLTGFYWTLTTMSTLGFGDITFAGDLGKFFSVVVLLSGIIFLLVMLPFTFIQFFYAPWLEEQNKARAPRQAPENITDHVIFTHFDAVISSLIQKLDQYGIKYVILTSELQTALDLHDHGYQVVVGDLDDPQTYKYLRIDRAALVAVLNDDISSTNIIFTIREINALVPTVTNADMDDSLDILALAGSTHVFQFSKMLGRSLARRVLGLGMKANVIGRFDQLIIAEAPAMRTWLQGKTLAQSRLRETTGATVIGAWEQGKFLEPSPDLTIGESTVLVLGGTEEQLDDFDRSLGHGVGEKPRKGPVIVLGGGRVGRAVADALEKREIDYRVVEKKPVVASKNSRVIQGNAADYDILVQAGIQETPSVIITTHDDNLNIYLTIYCRRLRPDVQIISRASVDRNINTMHRAGADLVMSYTSLVTTTILNLLQPQKILMLSEGLNIFKVELSPRLHGMTLLNAKIREKTGCSVLAVKRGEETMVNPEPDIELKSGDELVLVGTSRAEKEFISRFENPKQD